jgi:hypothetical protein
VKSVAVSVIRNLVEIVHIPKCNRSVAHTLVVLKANLD